MLLKSSWASKTLLTISQADPFPEEWYHILLDRVGQTCPAPISWRSALFPGKSSRRQWGTDQREAIPDNQSQLWVPFPAQRKVLWDTELFQRLLWHMGHAWSIWRHLVNGMCSVIMSAIIPTQLRRDYQKATQWPHIATQELSSSLWSSSAWERKVRKWIMPT